LKNKNDLQKLIKNK